MVKKIKGYLYEHPKYAHGGKDFKVQRMSDGITWTIWVDGEDIGEFRVVEEDDE
jgi:hypothetical protein